MSAVNQLTARYAQTGFKRNSYLFNLSLTTGSVPKCWKKKRVTPLFKKGNTDDYDFRNTSFDWFQSYLTDCVQCTVFDNTSSNFINEDPFGVPQCLVLGPLLFLLYINNINQSINTEKTFYHLYADGTIIIQSSEDPEQLKTCLNQQLSDISNWFHNNKLSVNTRKTEVIFFGKSDKVQECKSLSPL